MAITQNVRLYHEEGYAGQIASPLAISNRITAQNKTDAVIPYGTRLQAVRRIRYRNSRDSHP